MFGAAKLYFWERVVVLVGTLKKALQYASWLGGTLTDRWRIKIEISGLAQYIARYHGGRT
ncbi:MAG: hypothetical protein COA42_11865 [Alteromonadaceae bacterium]|nr:MAG: hypothetical protein COA42_11865 [Alteromonadaceae bacterium]